MSRGGQGLKNLKWGRKQGANAKVERRLPQLLFCHTSRLPRQHCATLLFLGAKCGCYIIFLFFFLVLSRGNKLHRLQPGPPHLLAIPPRGTECTHFVWDANLSGLSHNGHPRATSSVSTKSRAARCEASAANLA